MKRSIRERSDKGCQFGFIPGRFIFVNQFSSGRFIYSTADGAKHFFGLGFGFAAAKFFDNRFHVGAAGPVALALQCRGLHSLLV